MRTAPVGRERCCNGTPRRGYHSRRRWSESDPSDTRSDGAANHPGNPRRVRDAPSRSHDGARRSDWAARSGSLAPRAIGRLGLSIAKLRPHRYFLDEKIAQSEQYVTNFIAFSNKIRGFQTLISRGILGSPRGWGERESRSQKQGNGGCHASIPLTSGRPWRKHETNSGTTALILAERPRHSGPATVMSVLDFPEVAAAKPGVVDPGVQRATIGLHVPHGVLRPREARRFLVRRCSKWS